MPYTNIMDSGIIIEQKYDELFKVVQDNNPPTPSNNVSTALGGIPNSLWHKSKVTMDHNGDFHNIYINFFPDLRFQFAIWRNAQPSKVDLAVPLPYFKKIEWPSSEKIYSYL